MKDFSPSPFWGFRSVSFWMVLLVALGLIFIGIHFLADPAASASDFGIPIGNDPGLVFGRIKGIRDLYCGILLCMLLYFRLRRLTGYLFGAAIIIPFTDGLLVLMHNGITDTGHIAIHWGTVLFCLIAVGLLFSKSGEKRPTP